MKLVAVLGNYIPNTFMTRVDARAKLFILLVSTVGLFVFDTYIAFLYGVAICALSMYASECTCVSFFKALKPASVILVFALLANSLVLDSSGDIFLVGSMGINLEGATRGLCAVLRIIILIGLALTFTTSTTPPEVADASASLLSPLRRVGLPVRDIGIIISIALRFIPIVDEELERIQLSQMARGVSFTTGSLIQRIRAWLSVIAPLIVSLFVRADLLAEAMEARCYSYPSVKQISSKQMSLLDKMLIVITVIFFLICWVL